MNYEYSIYENEYNNWSNTSESSSLHRQFLCSFNLSQTVLLCYCDLNYLCYSLKKNLGPEKLQMFGNVDHLREAFTSLPNSLNLSCFYRILLECFLFLSCSVLSELAKDEDRTGRISVLLSLQQWSTLAAAEFWNTTDGVKNARWWMQAAEWMVSCSTFVLSCLKDWPN